MLHVERDDIEADIEGCSPNNQVFYGNRYSLGRLLSFDPSSKLSDSQRDRMHHHIAGQLIGKGFTACLVGVRPSPVDAMRQLDNADSRQGTLDVTVNGANAQDDLLDALSAPLPCDQDAGVED
jgi:hypothetical protein